MTCQDFRASVLGWIESEMDCRPTDNGCLSATLPLFKPNGDAIEIGIEPIGEDAWRISDLGETYATLYLAGVDMYEEYVRAEEFRQIKEAHHIDDEEKELSVGVSGQGRLVDSVFDFAHAIQSALALQFTVQPRQTNRDFASVVAKFLAEQGTAFDIPAEHVDGKSGKWKFNFVLNHSGATMMKTITAATKSQALRSSEQAIFEINDVKALHDVNVVVVTDDEGARDLFWQPATLRVYREYQVPVYKFHADRNELLALAGQHARPT